MLVSLADNLHELRLKIDGDRLSEDERNVDITALFVDKEELTSQVGSLKHLLAEVKEALKTEISMNKEKHAHGTELVKVRDRRIMELEKTLFCLKQQQRKHKTRKLGGA
jgi:hypothetical protein